MRRYKYVDSHIGLFLFNVVGMFTSVPEIRFKIAAEIKALRYFYDAISVFRVFSVLKINKILSMDHE